MPAVSYRGRFAPTPSGPLHRGSIVAALASWLDARAHGGQWLVRIEDTDTPRCVPGADAVILEQLKRLGLRSDEPVQWQSRRTAHYEHALRQLLNDGRAYGCACSRLDIAQALAARGAARARHAAAVYPGTCRQGLSGRPARAWRVRVADGGTCTAVHWTDRRLGPQCQDVSAEVGDFVVRRADGLWAYQLAVVVDDALQGITHVVRGEDLCDNTPRQIVLQRLLAYSTPQYLHTPLVWAADGQKLSKQTGAEAVDCRQPLTVLQNAAEVLDLTVKAPDNAEGEATDAAVSRWLSAATRAWARRWRCPPKPGESA